MPETQLLGVRNRSEVQGHVHPWLNGTVCLRPARSARARGSSSNKGKGEKGWNVCLITFTFGLNFAFRGPVELDFFPH